MASRFYTPFNDMDTNRKELKMFKFREIKSYERNLYRSKSNIDGFDPDKRIVINPKSEEPKIEDFDPDKRLVF